MLNPQQQEIPVGGIECNGPPKLENFTDDNQVQLSKDGLELNYSGYNYGTVRGNVKVFTGRWYFEVKLKSGGSARIGWASDKFVPESRYVGLGNDEQSWAFDGSRKTKHYNDKNGDGSKPYGDYWSTNDVIGCSLDLDARKISYTKNGKDMGVAFTGVRPGAGLSPAASVYRNTRLIFNFGRQFDFPPNYCCPLDYSLSADQKKSLTALFDNYHAHGIKLSESGDTGEIIKGQGILQLAQDLGAQGDQDPLLLILAWKLRCEVVWEITKEEWLIGFALYGACSLNEVIKKVKEWRNEITNDRDQFRSFYNFIFEYLKDPKSTALDKVEALMAWSMLDMGASWRLWEKWEEFLKQASTKAITRDTWQMLLTFIDQIGEDVSNYDPMDCWPIVMDEFCDYINKGK